MAHRHIIQNDGRTYALLNKEDIISNAVLHRGFELDVHQATEEILKNVGGGLVLDIGANLGSYTVPMAMKYPHLQFHSFEPQKTIFYQLCTNIFLNGLENVYANHCALSNSAWSKEFEVPEYAKESNIGAFSVDTKVRENDYEVLTRGKLETIRAIRLDELQIKNIKLIKIDIEGHELQALQGAGDTLKDSGYPPIIFEAWNWKFPEKQEELFGHLKDLGYSIASVGAHSNYLAVYQGKI
jgi:FkbM family methyltransferase